MLAFFYKKNFYLVAKQNKEKFVKKVCRFVVSEFVKTCDELVIGWWMWLATSTVRITKIQPYPKWIPLCIGVSDNENKTQIYLVSSKAILFPPYYLTNCWLEKYFIHNLLDTFNLDFYLVIFKIISSETLA